MSNINSPGEPSVTYASGAFHEICTLTWKFFLNKLELAYPNSVVQPDMNGGMPDTKNCYPDCRLESTEIQHGVSHEGQQLPGNDSEVIVVILLLLLLILGRPTPPPGGRAGSKNDTLLPMTCHRLKFCNGPAWQ